MVTSKNKYKIRVLPFWEKSGLAYQLAFWYTHCTLHHSLLLSFMCRKQHRLPNGRESVCAGYKNLLCAFIRYPGVWPTLFMPKESQLNIVLRTKHWKVTLPLSIVVKSPWLIVRAAVRKWIDTFLTNQNPDLIETILWYIVKIYGAETRLISFHSLLLC